MQTSGAARRENADTHSAVIVREGGRSSIPEAAVIESRSRSVLDTPHSRSMTAVRVTTDLRGKCLRDEPGRPAAAPRISSSFAVPGSGFVLRRVLAQHAFVALQSPFAIRPLGEPVGDSDLRVDRAGAHGDAGLVAGGDDLFETELAVAENGDESDEHGGPSLIRNIQFVQLRSANAGFMPTLVHAVFLDAPLRELPGKNATLP